MSIRREISKRIILGNRQKKMRSLMDELHSGMIDRRDFLTATAALLAYAGAHPTVAATTVQNVITDDSIISVDLWNTLSAVQDHLFPTTSDAPGAKEIHATSYLKAALAEPDMDPDNREFIKNGIGWLNDIAEQRIKAVFVDLDEDQREDVLRHIEKTSAGKRWISLLLLFIFEALLSDPVYGGNPGGIGWKWLQHQTGFPRPPVNQRYQDL